MELGKTSLIDRIKNIRINEIYYLLVILAYISTLFIAPMRPGVFATVMMIAVAAELIVRKMIKFENTLDIILIVYFIYNVASVIWLLRSGMPLAVYATEFISSVLPVIFYYVGRNSTLRTEKFYEMFIYAILLVGIVGIILYILAPQFYIDYSYRMVFISKADVPTMRVRMDSVVGSTVLGFMGVCSMIAGLYFVMNTNKKRVIKGIIYTLISFVIAIMSNQRSAMVVAFLVIVYANILVFFEFNLFKKKYFVIECIVIAAIFIALCVVSFDVVLKIWWRLESLPGAISERSEQWIAAVNNMYSTWLGNGLGANGHRAIGIDGAHVIADGGLVKLYCEEGIVGFSLFIYMIILCFTKNKGKLSELYVEFGIIAAMLLQSIGSNIICFQLAVPIFWFAIGRCALMISGRNE